MNISDVMKSRYPLYLFVVRKKRVTITLFLKNLISMRARLGDSSYQNPSRFN